MLRLLGLLILFLYGFSCKPAAAPEAPAPAASAEKKARPVNAHPLKEYPFDISLIDHKDKTHHSAQILPQAGKPTVVLFWLTTCNPCARELHAMKQNFEAWQAEVPFHMVAISEDWEDNFPAFVERVEKEQWPFPAYWDRDRVFKEILPGNLNGLPQTFIYDKDGKMTWKKRGFLPGDESLYFEKIKEASGT